MNPADNLTNACRHVVLAIDKLPAGFMEDVMETPLMLNTKQVMAELNHGRTRVFALIKSGELRSVKSGRRRLVHRRDLEDYAERLRQSGGAA